MNDKIPEIIKHILALEDTVLKMLKSISLLNERIIDLRSDIQGIKLKENK